MLNRILILICFLLAPLSIVAAENNGVKMAVDLKQAGNQAKQQNIPLMMFFAAEDCNYCERLEADYLHAMANSTEYKKRVIIRKIIIDGYDKLLDFNGRKISASDFSDRFNIQVTPTLVLLDHEGSSIGKRIVGYNNSGFFGAELDSTIDFAIDKLR